MSRSNAKNDVLSSLLPFILLVARGQRSRLNIRGSKVQLLSSLEQRMTTTSMRYRSVYL